MKRAVKRTSLNLDLKLVAEARDELGTKNTTDTVHAALEVASRPESAGKLIVVILPLAMAPDAPG